MSGSLVRKAAGMSVQPIVSIVMPVFNQARFLSEAIDSILGQTFADFDLLIIDDGSTDGCSDLLASVNDSRLRVWRNERNLGITPSLKRGISMARGTYIARMDADDVALPERLAMQAAFLDKHLEVGILGSACTIIDAEGKYLREYSVPVGDLMIRWTSLIASPFAHPSVMFRRSFLEQYGLNYDETYATAQDYDLWTRALKHTRGANLDVPLIRYRISHGITGTRRQNQLENHDRIAFRTIQEQAMGISVTLTQVRQLRTLVAEVGEPTPDIETDRLPLLGLYLDLLKAFLRSHAGDPGLENVKRRATLRIARLLLPPPLQRGLVGVVRRLVAVDPGVIARLSIAWPKALMNRLWRQTDGFVRAR